MHEVERLCAACREQGASHPVRRLLDLLADGAATDRQRLWDLVEAESLRLDPWDLIVVAAALAEPNIPGLDCRVPGVTADAWCGSRIAGQ